MSKKNSAARKPRTHFEQIPLEAVKKTARRVNSPDKAGSEKARTPKVRR